MEGRVITKQIVIMMANLMVIIIRMLLDGANEGKDDDHGDLRPIVYCYAWECCGFGGMRHAEFSVWLAARDRR